MTKANAARNAQPTGGKKPQPVERPKILRIGIVQGGRIIEEKLIRERRDVSIGQAARNTFIIPSGHLPAHFNLLQVDGATYTLKFVEGMDGRIGVSGSVKTLMQLKQSGIAKKRGDFWYLKLETSARGKLTVGDVTVLFQFVKAPAVRPKSRLPSFIRGGLLGQWDWTFGSIMSGTFAAHLALAILFLVVEKPEHIGGGRFDRVVKVEVQRQVQEARDRRKADDDSGVGAGEQAEAEEGGDEEETEKSTAKKTGPAEDAGDDRADPSKPKRLDAETEDALVRGLTMAGINADDERAAFRTASVLTPTEGDGSGPIAQSGGDSLARGMENAALDRDAERFGSAGGDGGGGPGAATRGTGSRIKGTGKGVGKGISGPSSDVTESKPKIKKPSGPKPKTSAQIPSLGGEVPSSLAGKIRNALRARVHGLRRIYDSHLQTNRFKCSLTVSFIINKNGRLSNVNVAGGCPGSFTTAVRNNVNSWRLPPGAQGFQKFTVNFSY